MEKYIESHINEGDIKKIELLCSLEDDKDLIKDLEEKVIGYTGKSKILLDAYLTIMYLTDSIDSDLSLEGIRVVTNNNERIHVSTYDIKESRVIVSDNSLRFMLNVLNCINKGQNVFVKTLDYKMLEYVDYDKETSLVKTKGGK